LFLLFIFHGIEKLQDNSLNGRQNLTRCIIISTTELAMKPHTLDHSFNLSF